MALVNRKTCSGVAIIGRLKICHLAARMPKLFSIILLALFNLYLKIASDSGRYLPGNGRIKLVRKGKASSPTNTNGTTVLVPGSALGGGIAKLSDSMA